MEFGHAEWSPTRNEIAFFATIDEHALCGTGVESAPRNALFVVRADGTDLKRVDRPRDAPSWWNRVETDIDRVWSPDGNRLALTLFTDQYSFEDRNVLVVTRTGGVSLTSIFAEPTSWAPDSRRLGVFLNDPTDSPTGPAVLDLRNAHVQRIGPYLSTGIDWSPRGNLVAYGHGGYLYVERPNGTKRRRLVRAGRSDWSGDGTLLAFVRPLRGSWSGGYVVEPNGRNVQRMPGSPTDWAWSPRGRAVAFGRELYDFATGERWRVLPRTLAPVKAIWSPNGRRLAYPGIDKLFAVDRNGRHGHTIRWPTSARVSDPSWSPTGSTFAFTTEKGLYVVGADGRHGHYVPLRLCEALTARN